MIKASGPWRRKGWPNDPGARTARAVTRAVSRPRAGRPAACRRRSQQCSVDGGRPSGGARAARFRDHRLRASLTPSSTTLCAVRCENSNSNSRSNIGRRCGRPRRLASPVDALLAFGAPRSRVIAVCRSEMIGACSRDVVDRRGFFAFMRSRRPFDRLLPAASDAALNPLLQDPGMVFHRRCSKVYGVSRSRSRRDRGLLPPSMPVGALVAPDRHRVLSSRAACVGSTGILRARLGRWGLGPVENASFHAVARRSALGHSLAC